MYRGIYVDAHSGGNLLQTRRGQRLINTTLDYAKAAFNYQWGVNAVILEPRPVVRRDALLDGNHQRR